MIGKFPSIGDERPIPKGEVLALTLARRSGINAAEARLIDSAGIPVTLVKRFDRQAGGRIMYVSAATMLGAETPDADHSYTEIVDILRSKGAAPQADIEELWRRIAFSILITNVDDHLHNHGFLHIAHDQWRLAPAFDLNPFPDRVRELKTWISEEHGPDASIEALMSVTPYFRIELSRAKNILAEVENAVSYWRRVAYSA
jgi:serine/threonine-protein kinase HipA